MATPFKSKILLVENGVVKNWSMSQLEVGEVHSVPKDTEVKIGDLYDGNAVTPDPDAAKKEALAAEKQKAIEALQNSDDKAAILKALTDAQSAVEPLAEIVKP